MCNVDSTHSAYYSFKDKKIYLCCNLLRSKEDVEDSLVHELVHAYDACRYPEFYCKVRACSEIRAYHIQGVCKKYKSLFSTYYYSNSVPNMDFYSLEECIKYHALRSMSEYCKKTAKSDIDDVFDQCFNDLTPLETRQRIEKMKGKGVFDPTKLFFRDKITSN